MADREERLDWAERWIADGFRVMDSPGGFAALDVDMSRARTLLQRLRRCGVPATHNLLIVRATALALARRPDLHRMVAGTRRALPEHIDVGLSVAGSTQYAPIMILKDAGRRSLAALAAEIRDGLPALRAKEEKDLAGMRRLGWLIPFGWMRRALLRILLARISFRRKLAGTFQVSCLDRVDLCVPFLFNTAACLGVGRVRNAVVAIEGQPVVRPVVTLAVSIDHKAWDGVRAAAFLNEVKTILDQGVLDAELSREVAA